MLSESARLPPRPSSTLARVSFPPALAGSPPLHHNDMELAMGLEPATC